MHKGAELAQALIRAGHEVLVITGFPNYPGGRIYDGYRVRPRQDEMIEGVPVIRLPLFPSHDNSVAGRIANYLSFALSGAIAAPWLVGRADACYVYHPPGTVGLPALTLRFLRRIPYVLDVEDLWPDTLEATDMLTNGTARRLVGWWMRQVYRHANHIAVLSPGFKRRLQQRGVPGSKISVIHNWWLGGTYEDRELDASIRSVLAERFNVVFAGNMGKAQALQAVLEAGKCLAGSHPDVQLVLVGDGVELEHLKQTAEDLHLSNVVFLPRLAHDEIEGLLNAANALLVHVRRDPLFSITIPSKTQAYLAAGRPIVMAATGDAAELVREAGAGVTCEPEDPRSIAEAIGSLADMSVSAREEMGRRGRMFYDEHLSIDRGVGQIAALLERAASDPVVGAGK